VRKTLGILVISLVLALAGTINAEDVAILELDTGLQVQQVKWSSDNQLLAVATDQGVKIYDLSLEEAVVQPESDIYIRSVEWSPDGAYLAASTADNEIFIWETPSSEEGYALLETIREENPRFIISTLAWSPDNTKLAAIITDPGEIPCAECFFSNIRIWDTKNWTAGILLDGTYRYVTDRIVWNSDSIRLAGGGYFFCPEEELIAGICNYQYGGESFFIADSNTGQQLEIYPMPHEPTDLTWQDENFLSVISGGDFISFDTQTQYVDAEIDQLRMGFPAYKIASAIDSRLAFIATLDDKVILWDIPTQSTLQAIEFPKVTGLDLTTDGKHLAIFSETGNLAVWEVEYLPIPTHLPTVTPLLSNEE
jgi:WD40 repeat protein